MRRFFDTSSTVVNFIKHLREYPSPHLAYISGWTGNFNLGDEVLFSAAGDLFDPLSIFPFHAERSIAYMNRVLRSVVGGVLAGGTLINSSRTYLHYMDKSTLLLPCTMVFGTGVCDPRFWERHSDFCDNRPEWGRVLRRCSYVGVRGPRSAELMQEVGVRAEVIGDPALAYFSDAAHKRELGSDICLGLNIGQSKGRVWGSEEQLLCEFTNLASTARRRGWKVSWFVVWPEDLEITKRAAEASATSNDIYSEFSSAEAYIAKAAQMTLFVGMKLHATILAICAGIPSLMVEYRPKCRDFMQSIDHEYATIRSDDFCASDAFALLEIWLAEYAIHQMRLVAKVAPVAARQRERARSLVEGLLSAID